MTVPDPILKMGLVFGLGLLEIVPVYPLGLYLCIHTVVVIPVVCSDSSRNSRASCRKTSDGTDGIRMKYECYYFL